MGSTQDVLLMKRELRKRMRELLRQVSRNELRERSAEACRLLTNSEVFRSARTVAAFCHMPTSEVETTDLLAACFAEGKRVFLPRVDEGSVRKMLFLEAHGLQDVESWPLNTMGIREPPSTWNGQVRREVRTLVERERKPLDLIVVPGLAFDTFGRRLGRGKGYYDTFLATCEHLHHEMQLPPPRRVGLALSCQLVTEVPVSAHDQVVEAVFYA